MIAVVVCVILLNKQNLGGNNSKIKYDINYEKSNYAFDISRKGYYGDGIGCFDTCDYNYVYVISMESQPSNGYSLAIVDVQ